MTWLPFAAILFLLATGCATFKPPQGPIKLSPFITDGCSSYPNGTWLHCCLAHDVPYWIGGPEKYRINADQEINRCVADNTNAIHGKMMELGIRIGGAPDTGFAWRWGYGWDRHVSYKKPTKKMRAMLKEKYNSIYTHLMKWKSKLSEKERIYIADQIEISRIDQDIDVPANYYKLRDNFIN